jgi:membrane-associated phospholipid phosphatase
MLEQIIKLDHQVFHAINTGMSNAFFDWLMPILRNKKVWIPLYIFIIAYFTYNYKLKGLYLVLFLAAAVGLADSTSAGIIKPLVNRNRPCTGKSFPSAHATDHFAIAIFMITVFFRRWKWIIYVGIFWAAAISFAQVYVGVHFPIDVISGMLWGSLIGFLVAKLCIRYLPIFDYKK